MITDGAPSAASSVRIILSIYVANNHYNHIHQIMVNDDHILEMGPQTGLWCP